MELERRDTPTWWAVNAPVPAEGTSGSTDATHAGTLTLKPEYKPTNGAVTVWADTAIKAATKALTGTITVTLQGQSIAYAFGPDTVGAAVADHKAFVAVATGSSVDIGFEDMAGLAGSDWDYNDRTWSGVSTASAPDPIVFEGDFTSGGGVSLHEKVTAQSETSWLWNYRVTNNNFASASGVGAFVVPMDWHAVTSSGGSNAVFYAMNSYFVPGTPNWWWVTRTDVMPGGSADLWFTTTPRTILDVTASAWQRQGQASVSISAKAPGPVIIQPVPLKAALQTATFSGANNFDVVADPGDAAYGPKPHWNDPDTDGIINAVGVDRQLPVGFVRGDTPMLAATFKLVTVDPAAKTAYVRADGPGDYDLEWTAATIAGNVLTLPATALKKALKNEVDHIPAATFVWEVCTALPANDASAAGKSTNELFVTLAKPTLVSSSSLGGVGGGAMSVWPTMYVTPLWLFCKSAQGTTDVDAAIRATFTNGYAGLSVTTHPDIDPLYKDPAVPIYYYKNWLNNNASFVTMLTPAVKDGQCAAWVDLFKKTLAEGGIDESVAVRYQISNAKAVRPSYLMVKQWVYTANSPGPDAFFKNFNTLKPANQAGAIAARGFVLGFALRINPAKTAEGQSTADNFDWGVSGALDGLGDGGQNTFNPLSLFNSHVVVRIGDTIYDPSYGKTSAWANDQAAWYKQSIAGYAIMDQDPDGAYVLRSGRIENAGQGLYDTYFDWKFTAVP